MAEQTNERDNALALAEPAPHVNKFFVSVLGNFAIRIAFAEQMGPESVPAMRAAILLNREDAAALSALLQEMLSIGDMPAGEMRGKAN